MHDLEKIIKASVSIFFGGGDPNKNIEIVEKLNHLFAVFTHKTVKIGEITEKNLFHSIAFVGYF